MKKAFKKYEVTLRRDVQQKLVVRVEAASRQDAIGVAEGISTAADDAAWQVEEFIGAHRPKVETAERADGTRWAVRHVKLRRAG